MHKLMMLVLVILWLPVFAQKKQEDKTNRKEIRRQKIDEIAKQEEEGVIKYAKHTIFGGKLTTDGYGAFLEIGRARSIRRSLLFQFDFSEKKHIKEVKTIRNVLQSSPTIYGKINFFYPVKLGVQQQYLLGNRSNKNGISISANFGGGLSLGLLRPYIIDIDNGNNSTKEVSYYSSLEEFLDYNRFRRGPGLFKGWDQMKVVPGIYAKPALRFDYGRYNEMVNALEVGITAEFYSKKIEQMAFLKQENFFISGFVAIVLGKRK